MTYAEAEQIKLLLVAAENKEKSQTYLKKICSKPENREELG